MLKTHAPGVFHVAPTLTHDLHVGLDTLALDTAFNMIHMDHELVVIPSTHPGLFQHCTVEMELGMSMSSDGDVKVISLLVSHA